MVKETREKETTPREMRVMKVLTTYKSPLYDLDAHIAKPIDVKLLLQMMDTVRKKKGSRSKH